MRSPHRKLATKSGLQLLGSRPRQVNGVLHSLCTVCVHCTIFLAASYCHTVMLHMFFDNFCGTSSPSLSNFTLISFQLYPNVFAYSAALAAHYYDIGCLQLLLIEPAALIIVYSSTKAAAPMAPSPATPSVNQRRSNSDLYQRSIA